MSLQYEEALRQGVGGVCEVMSMDNDPLFVGRLAEYDGMTGTVTPSAGREPPYVLCNQEVKIQLHLPGGGVAVIGAAVRGSSAKAWWLDRFYEFQLEEHRDGFRQRIYGMAWVRRVKEDDPLAPSPFPEVECRMVDISVGGVQFTASVRYQKNHWLALRDVAVASDFRPFQFLCQVCWLDDRDPLRIRYGCGFTSLRERERDRLFSAIIAAQREALKRQRERMD